MKFIFYESAFTGDLNNWKPYKLEDSPYITFDAANCSTPYWTKAERIEERVKIIDAYWLNKELEQELKEKKSSEKKLKL
jgi:hypothetical protein